jgi:glycosyltransferase involved in cell wall biosynthesis
MKLVLYSHYFSPSIGGVETVVLALAKGLANRLSPGGAPAFEITLVTETPAGEVHDSLFPFRVIRQPGTSQLRRLLREADVVHVAGAAIPLIFWSLFAHKPVVVEHHGFQTICPTGQLFQEPQNVPCPGHFMAGHHATCLRCCRAAYSTPASFRLWLLTFVRRGLCKFVSVNITPTAWLANLLGLPRTETVSHGLPSAPALLRIAGSHDVPSIVFVGRLVSTKGVRILLEAARILQERNRSFAIHIVGSGPERVSLETMAQEWQLTSHFVFHGRLPDADVTRLLEKAGAVVVPSLGGEVFGMVVAENMLRGLPIIASDLGAFVEVLGDTGQTFRTGYSADLAEQIERILDNPALSQRFASAAHQRVIDVFTEERMIDGHARIYERLHPV